MSTTATDTAALILSGEGYHLEIAPDATEQKTRLIEAASTVQAVSTEQDATAARNHVKNLAAMRNLVEKSRKEIKAPVLQVGRDIDEKAADFVAEITAEEKRIAGLIASYAAAVEAERKRLMAEQEAARRKAEAEARAAEEARLKAEREAEEARKAAEEAFWADDDEKAQEAAKVAAEKEALVQEVVEAVSDIVQVVGVVMPAPAAPEGVKWEPTFEVVDVHALYRFSPEFVELKERRKPILDAIKHHMDRHEGALPDIPGLRVSKQAKVSTR